MRVSSLQIRKFRSGISESHTRSATKISDRLSELGLFLRHSDIDGHKFLTKEWSSHLLNYHWPPIISKQGDCNFLCAPLFMVFYCLNQRNMGVLWYTAWNVVFQLELTIYVAPDRCTVSVWSTDKEANTTVHKRWIYDYLWWPHRHSLKKILLS
jgi:hypothetical protein